MAADGGATTADSVTGSGASAALAQSPGRISPTAPAYNAGSTLTSPATTRTEPSSASRKPLAQRYDYVFDGDSESRSALLVSPALNRLVASAIPVHINADFAGQTSDHDPLLAYINPPR